MGLGNCDLPIVCYQNLVRFLATLLAKVFVRGRLGAEDSDASAMLPNLANVALNEEAGNIFSELMCEKEVGLWGVDWRGAGILLRAADASDGLILLVLNVFASGHDNVIRGRPLGLVVLAAFPPATEERVVEVLERLRRQRSAGCRLARRGLIERPGIALEAARRARGHGGLL